MKIFFTWSWLYLLLFIKSFFQMFQFSLDQSFSHVRLFATPWTAARQASLSITNSQSLLKLMSIESMMTSNHLILCRPLLLPPSIFPRIRVFFFLIYFFYFILIGGYYFTILYWFCHTSTWIHPGCTRVPNPEPPSNLPPHTIPLGHPSAPAPSILYPASNLDWRVISYMILYMFQCHSPKSLSQFFASGGQSIGVSASA